MVFVRTCQKTIFEDTVENTQMYQQKKNKKKLFQNVYGTSHVVRCDVQM